jgi:hypothetical protein
MRDTIDIAREVDPVTKLLLDKKLPQGMDHDVFMWFLERFEALVRADERDGCILELERNADKTLEDIVAAIRERGNA